MSLLSNHTLQTMLPHVTHLIHHDPSQFTGCKQGLSLGVCHSCFPVLCPATLSNEDFALTKPTKARTVLILHPTRARAGTPEVLPQHCGLCYSLESMTPLAKGQGLEHWQVGMTQVRAEFGTNMHTRDSLAVLCLTAFQFYGESSTLELLPQLWAALLRRIPREQKRTTSDTFLSPASRVSISTKA